MQTDTINEPLPDIAQPESPEANPHTEALGQLEAKVRELEQSFDRLATLQSELQDLELGFQEICGEERRILTDETATESQATKKLLECRAKKDLRHERLQSGKKRISDLIDTITLDDGPDLRRSFARFAHSLLMQKEREIMALFNELLPVGSNVNVSNVDLVPASAPVTRVRQVSNWCSGQSNPDQQQELEHLRELPRKWLAALCRLIEGKDPFERA